MTPLKQEYLQLVSLMKTLLDQEFAFQPPQLVDAPTHQFFKQLSSAQRPAPPQTRPAAPPAPAPVQNKPTPLPPPKAPPLVVAPAPKAPTPLPPQPPKTVVSSTEAPKGPTRFQLEPLGPAEVDAFADVKRAVHQAHPRLPIIDHPPEDSTARQIAQAWQKAFPNVVVLSLQEIPEHQEFLSKLTSAIDQRLTHAALLDAKKLENENEWERLSQAKNLRLVIIGKSLLNALPRLKTLSQTTPTLPLLFLEEIALYLQNPSLKASLWKTLCDRLKP